MKLFSTELLPNELRDQLPKLYAQEKSEDAMIFAKFYFSEGNWTWFVSEGETQGDDFIFFGYVVGFEEEWGYFSLRELEEININGRRIQRDSNFQKEEFSICLARWRTERTDWEKTSG
jgi:Protein of unknown function (DUF2958)